MVQAVAGQQVTQHLLYFRQLFQAYPSRLCHAAEHMASEVAAEVRVGGDRRTDDLILGYLSASASVAESALAMADGTPTTDTKQQ